MNGFRLTTVPMRNVVVLPFAADQFCSRCGRRLERRWDGVGMCPEHGAVCYPMEPPAREEQPEVLA